MKRTGLAKENAEEIISLYDFKLKFIISFIADFFNITPEVF